MGNGFSCRCSNCSYYFYAMFGVGIRYPSEYESTLQEARAGEFGEDISGFLKAHPDAAINAGLSVYVCPNCRNLQCETNMGLYLKKENVEIPEDNTRWSTAFAGEGIEYVDPAALRKYYKLSRPGKHVCDKCGTKMKKLPERTFVHTIEQHQLLCPDCGSVMGDLSKLFWD